MKPSYKTNDPLGWCGDSRRGAAMGRSSIHLEDKTKPVKLYLSKVRMSGYGDYDSNGTYFGAGDPLYWVANEDLDIDFVIRATDRDNAKSKVKFQYPNATFFK